MYLLHRDMLLAIPWSLSFSVRHTSFMWIIAAYQDRYWLQETFYFLHNLSEGDHIILLLPYLLHHCFCADIVLLLHVLNSPSCILWFYYITFIRGKHVGQIWCLHVRHIYNYVRFVCIIKIYTQLYICAGITWNNSLIISSCLFIIQIVILLPIVTTNKTHVMDIFVHC